MPGKNLKITFPFSTVSKLLLPPPPLPAEAPTARRRVLLLPLLLPLLLFSLLPLFFQNSLQAQQPFRVIGYYAGPLSRIDSIDTQKLTHLIYCFGHLDGHRLRISGNDSAAIRKMVAFKSQHPQLKVMLSLGGWGGCATCSDAFSTDAGRREFAASVRELTLALKSDGIDLDWEYPAIQGYPGHRFHPDDKEHFTALLKAIRELNPPPFEISFAAGGFTSYIDSSVEWKEAIKYTDFINIMSYDLVHGYSTTSGHHTPLYSTPQQTESTDHAVTMLLAEGVPAEKLVIGSAFYGRFFKINEGHEPGLYQPCRFLHAFSFKYIADSLSAANGFECFWDPVAQAPYAINRKRNLLATYDNERSVAVKTLYARRKNLGGIMFWQLIDDKTRGGLLEVIDSVK